MEELVKFTLMTRDISDFLVDRYSERLEKENQAFENWKKRIKEWVIKPTLFIRL